MYIECVIYFYNFLGTTPKSKSNKLSPGAPNKKRKLTNTPKKEKDEPKNVNGAEIVKNAQVENDTVESEQEKEESTPPEKEFGSDEAKKTKNIVKKKRARIIELVDSSDDEDHLPVNLDHSEIDNSLAKEFIFWIKFICL